MKKSAGNSMSTSISGLLSLGLSLFIFAACTSSSSVPLTGPAAPAPANPGEQGGDAKPTPTPSPTPADGQPTPTPSPTPVAQKTSRIYCMPGSVNGSAMLNSVPGDAVENYKMANFSFFLADGTRAGGVKFPTSLRSDGRDGVLILKAQFGSATDGWKIYKAKIDFLKEQGVLTVLSNYTGEPNGYPYAKENLNLPLKMTDSNYSRTAFVYPNDKGTYVLQTTSGSKTVLPISADRAANPKFVRDSWIAFDQQDSGYKITQKFYSVKSGKISSIPSASDSRDHQLFGFVGSDNTLYWVEGRPSNGWKFRSSKGTLATLSGAAKDIQIPMAIFEDGNGKVRLAYLEEKIDVDTRGTLFTKTGLLHLIGVSSGAKVTENRSIEYSDRIKNMIVRPKTSSAELLRSLFFEPVSGNVYASIYATGGLASYDLKENSWGVHATSDLCFNPSPGIEEIYE